MTFRALLFCHEGTSLGHLQFLCRIADGLHPEIACLIVTGMREINYLIPRTCEYVKLPSWDYLLQARAEARGSAFSFDLDENQAKILRSLYCAARARCDQASKISATWEKPRRPARARPTRCARSASCARSAGWRVSGARFRWTAPHGFVKRRPLPSGTALQLLVHQPPRLIDTRISQRTDPPE